MDVLAYLLDTNVVSDYLRGRPEIVDRVSRVIDAGEIVGLCPPVHYEVTRGLLRVDARRQLEKYYLEFVPMMSLLPVLHDDWNEAAQLWRYVQQRGRQLSDVDLLIAAMAIRLDAVLVTADGDFSALPVKRENWRVPQA